MRKLIALAVVVATTLALAGTAQAKVTKYTFNDVAFPDGTSGEIEASVKTTNKSQLVYCGYFSSGYADSLGYYQQFTDSPPTTADGVETFCLDHYGDRE